MAIEIVLAADASSSSCSGTASGVMSSANVERAFGTGAAIR
jgi:hypothetical protein